MRESSANGTRTYSAINRSAFVILRTSLYLHSLTTTQTRPQIYSKSIESTLNIAKQARRFFDPELSRAWGIRNDHFMANLGDVDCASHRGDDANGFVT